MFHHAATFKAKLTGGMLVGALATTAARTGLALSPNAAEAEP